MGGGRELKALYAQLVDGGVLQPKEFWQGQQALLRSEAGRQATAQRAGLSSAMLGDVQRNADGQSERVRALCCPMLLRQTCEHPFRASSLESNSTNARMDWVSMLLMGAAGRKLSLTAVRRWQLVRMLSAAAA